MKIEKIYLDWDSVDSFQSDGKETCILYLTNRRIVRVNHSFQELMTMKDSFRIDSDVVLDLIDE